MRPLPLPGSATPRPLDWNPCFRFAPFTHFPKEPGSSRCLILLLKCHLSAPGPSPKEIVIKSGSDLFQLWDLDQYPHDTNLLKFVFCLFCLFLILFYFVKETVKFVLCFQVKEGYLHFHQKQKVAITAGLNFPLVLFLVCVSLPNWYVFCLALDDLVES